MKINHTRILNAYLSRLTTNDLESIMKANYAWEHASMNHNSTAQLKAQENFQAALSHAIGNLIQLDIIYIEKAILEEVAK